MPAAGSFAALQPRKRGAPRPARQRQLWTSAKVQRLPMTAARFSRPRRASLSLPRLLSADQRALPAQREDAISFPRTRPPHAVRHPSPARYRLRAPARHQARRVRIRPPARRAPPDRSGSWGKTSFKGGKPASDPALDRAKRCGNPRRDFGMRKAVDESEDNGAALVGFERFEAVPQRRCIGVGVESAERLGFDGGLSECRVAGQNLAPVLAHRIQRSEPYNSGEPCRGRAAFWYKAPGVLPNLYK